MSATLSAKRKTAQLIRPLSRRERRAVLLFGIAIAGSAVLTAGLPLNLAPADPFIGVILVLGLTAMFRGEGGPFRNVIHRSAPFVWLLALASAVSLFGVGFALWAVDHGTRDLLSLFAFGVFGSYLWSRRRVVDRLLYVFVATGVVVALSALASSGGALRQSGALFRNPNYTAHFLATVIILAAYAKLRSRTKLVVIVVMLTGILTTGSFGGASLLLGSAVVLPYRRLALFGPGARTIARLVLVLFVGYLVIVGLSNFTESDADLGSGLSSDRLERSSGTRFEIWMDAVSQLPEHPGGVGPRGLVARESIESDKRHESHNDYVAFLAETGPLGLVAFLGISTVIWRTLPSGGSARVLMIGFAVTSLSREIVNFRHVWLALVLLALLDLQERDRGRPLAPVRPPL